MSILEQHRQDYERYLERGAYHSKQGNYQQALEDYSKSLYNCEVFFSIAGHEESSKDVQISFTINFASLIRSIAVCYHRVKQPRKAFFFARQFKRLVDVLGQQKDNFNVSQLQQYEELSKSNALEILNVDVGELQPDDLSDETFQANIKNFDKICSIEICLLRPREGSSSSSGGCFIATAAYSTFTHPDLDTFRNFRDEKLLTHSVGKRLVSLYYQISPTIAQYVEKLPILKNFLRLQLGRLAQWMRDRGVTSN